LVVDDVEDMLDLLEIALHASGFAVVRASSFSEALDLFDTHSSDIDLLMTDLRVGTESGLELARRLVASKPTLQVLAISGFALDGKAVTARNKIQFLPKPFSTSELRKKLLSIFTPEPAQLTVTVSSDSPGSYKVSTACSVPKRRGGLGD
jgi:two-component system response regulator PilR (NtrC family)